MNLDGVYTAIVHRADPEAPPASLGSLLHPGPVLLVFVRHFGCTGCSQNVTDLQPWLRELSERGVQTVIVGTGKPTHLRGFVERFRLQDYAVEAVTDPTRRAHTAAGLRRSWWGTLGPRGLWDLLAGFGRGHLNGLPQGDTAQQGGTLLLGPEVDGAREVVLQHVNQSLADHAPAVELAEAALALQARGGAAELA